MIFTRKSVQKLLNLSDKTVTKAFKELADCNLIYEKKQGATKPNLIYVGQIQHEEMNRRKYDSKVVKFTNYNTENLRSNYNYINYNKKNKKSFSNFEGNYSNVDWDLLYDN